MVTKSTALVASRIAAAAKEAGMSEVRLADETGIARTTLRRKLKGLQPFTVPELVLIGKALKVNFVRWLRNLPKDAA